MSIGLRRAGFLALAAALAVFLLAAAKSGSTAGKSALRPAACCIYVIF
ncbi:MAG: hypothetical protein R3C60_03635 [Parvularculaceae bacterium]